jgi:hypothetical protein
MTTLFIKFFVEFLNNLYGNSILLKQSIPSLASKQIIIRDRYFVKPLLQLLIKIDINRIFRCRKFNFKEMCHIKVLY